MVLLCVAHKNKLPLFFLQFSGQYCNACGILTLARIFSHPFTFLCIMPASSIFFSTKNDDDDDATESSQKKIIAEGTRTAKVSRWCNQNPPPLHQTADNVCGFFGGIKTNRTFGILLCDFFLLLCVFIRQPFIMYKCVKSCQVP